MRSRGILARIVPVSRPGWGSPGQGLPGEPGEPPDWGIDEGEPPQVEPPDIEPPPGIWPGPSPGHPIEPIPPGSGGDHPSTGFPPGAIWPRPPAAHGKFIVLAHVPGYGWRYFSVDMDAIPEPPAGGVGRPPARPEPTR